MKININNIKIGAILLIVIVTASCRKLDTYPLTSYYKGNYWKHPNHANAALNGAYTLLQSTLNTEFVYYGEARADLLKLHIETNTQSINVINNRMDVNMAFADWSNFYKIVRQCNLILKHLPIMLQNNLYQATSSESMAEYNRIVGQAHALRALCYFYMVRIWGDVPLITEPVEVVEDINVFKTPRTPKNIVYQQISADLNTARGLLPATYTDSKLNRSHITRGAVDAMLTDYYMWTGNIDSAIITSDRLVKYDGTIQNTNYSLVQLTGYSSQIDNSPYAKMFIDGYSPESIFEIAYNLDENSTSVLYGIYGGNTIAQFEVRREFVDNKFDTGDQRPIAALNAGKRFIFKFFPKSGFNRATENDKNIIMYRLADIYLLKAEALVKKGDRPGALNLINKIRQRAGASLIDEADFFIKTDDQALNEVLDERARELCFEGKRWFDLVRNNKAIEVMQPLNGLSDPENILWPINLKIIRQNPTIEQNAFYK